MIRKATEQDIEAIARIYEDIHTQNERGILTTGWVRGIYPTRETAVTGVNRGDAFVMEEAGRVVACARINGEQDAAWQGAAWSTAPSPDEVLVLHTLVVAPEEAGKGYGKAFVAFYEDYARSHGCRHLRMDTNERNRGARALYAKLGYRECGIVTCVFNNIPDVHLVCLEKILED